MPGMGKGEVTGVQLSEKRGLRLDYRESENWGRPDKINKLKGFHYSGIIGWNGEG